ncbi:2-amino-4-hydroxy-6-hydroxymethyldihydropteridine diphosphokinase [Acinetobacter larvae]|uniref:2-amino-4-hydroxy-6-hydroxymethyldihydropteridine pyrophosphokinase n=2 Tax=Acinetobacter larvae TaxID=1789224 RepID=A0A1B2M4C6_9GAMM|nr:2-amino-4-hydroxy-6-hydroxymethyldihydropteridine diphosphokinase [Acinetobacter larvae]AOA60001.1 2-amino-4-hydroxy-6-hydroxymethyldihydropteridine diphosphokinase [Acinetobacter larvae]
MQCVYIGIGSNLGDSPKIMRHAVEQLAQWGPLRASSLYHSAPMGPQDQPHYHNAVVQLHTSLAPLDLLDVLQDLEQQAGRVRLRHWGERTLDLDLLLYGDQQISVPRLTVPHTGLLERDFVVIPLLELDATLCVAGQSLQQLTLLKDSTLHLLADSSWVTC